ncbi:hypothetical protein LTR08_007083 [Meristemomyces frigidus]|nr:hypothetical protein LTR08_007083 [Meristemomyces frigidus]
MSTSASSAHSAQRSTYPADGSSANGSQASTTAMASDAPQRSSGGSGRSRQHSQNVQFTIYELLTQCNTMLTIYQPQQQLSTIEKSVTHLLVATKQLLETLTMWSRGTASESEVSDVYVRLGYEFNIACRAFNAIGVDTGDLGPVPDLLRQILEDTLSQEANQGSLDKFLPRIRDIIINLLHGLKKKQQRLRQKNGSTREGEAARPPRQASTASNISIESSLTQQLDDIPSRHSSSRSFAQRARSGEAGGPDLPPRTTSTTAGTSSPRRQHLSPQNSMREAASHDIVHSDSRSSLSSNAMQDIPVIAPYPEGETMPTIERYELGEPSPEPPRPPPKHNDALSALQRGGDLERRASRRFSAYQIQKHLGTSMNGMAAIPPAQNSPIPNRGRDVRESMSAVRSRGSVLHSRNKSRNNTTGYEPSPNRLHEVRRISEAEETSSQASEAPPPPVSRPFVGDNDDLDSPMIKTPEDKLGAYPFPVHTEQESIRSTLNGPVEEPFVSDGGYTGPERSKAAIPRRNGSRQAIYNTPPQSHYASESSPQPGKELTLFLQYKSKIKKFVLPDGGDLSIPRLQLGFIEKFAWNTHNDGVDLPDIYIQDTVSGVRHELEDIGDIKERAVLVLNVEALDEVKRHFDDGIGGLRRIVEDIKTGLVDQQSALLLVSTNQQETAKELATIAAAPPTKAVRSTTDQTRNISVKDRVSQVEEVQALRRDLAVVRQTYTSFVSDMNASMATIRTKAAGVKKAAANASIPDMDNNSGRTYVNTGKKSLSSDSEKIVNRVDDLQDLVEDLRKDVVSRGVRPVPRQLESVSKDISTATSDLKKMQEYLRKEKPIWTKIWEKELQVVCDDRDLLTMQEELAADLEDDLEKAAATFALVEQATKQQNLSKPVDGAAAAGGIGARSSSRTLKPIGQGSSDPRLAKDGVLGEVRALQPNHESRLEAIERAERARQKELESRKEGEFQRELGSFVEEGKLKKSGGVEEVERLRKSREEKTRREVHERQAARAQEKAEKEAAAAVAAAQGLEQAANGVVPHEAAIGTITNGQEAGERGSSRAPSLEVPSSKHDEGDRSSSPEPVFVEAVEEVNASTESLRP